jgi:hypothetical protein
MLALGAESGCGGPATRSRDVAGDRRPRDDRDGGTSSVTAVPEPPRELVRPAVKGVKPRLFARASTRALAMDAANVYYGDSDDDGVYSMPKLGGTAVRIARHAPVAGALALDGGSIAWIASPGDAVLKAPLTGASQPVTVRDHGIFSDVATRGGDVFITEANGAGGALLRITGGVSSRLAAFEGPPRALLVDESHAYVITPTRILRTPNDKGAVETLATGAGLAFAEADSTFIYFVTESDKVKSIARVPKTGGPATTIARDVRDAPFEVDGGELLYFDATRPQLLAVASGGGPARVLADDDVLATATALEADAATVYVATGAREGGAIVAIARR